MLQLAPCREWIEHYLQEEIAAPPEQESVAGYSVAVGAKNLMAYAQLCLVAKEIGRRDNKRPVGVCCLITCYENGNSSVYRYHLAKTADTTGRREASRGWVGAALSCHDARTSSRPNVVFRGVSSA